MYPALYIGSKAVAVLIGLMNLSRAFETFHHSKLFTILEEIVSKVLQSFSKFPTQKILTS